jgi:hypothetical protein
MHTRQRREFQAEKIRLEAEVVKSKVDNALMQQAQGLHICRSRHQVLVIQDNDNKALLYLLHKDDHPLPHISRCSPNYNWLNSFQWYWSLILFTYIRWKYKCFKHCKTLDLVLLKGQLAQEFFF